MKTGTVSASPELSTSLLAMTQASRLCLFAFALLCCVSCASYKQSEPPQDGMFYPRECVTVGGASTSTTTSLSHYTVCGPVRVTEIGIRTYDQYFGNGNSGDHEVARLDIGGGLYVWTSTLRSVGRLELRSNSEGAFGSAATSVTTMAANATNGAVKLFIAVVIVVAVIGLIAAG